MLNAFAETLIVCTTYINQDTNEQSLYVLISSGFESLQKAGFFMLRHLYQNYIPSVLFKKDEENEIKQMQLMAEGQQMEEEQKQEDKETEVELVKAKVEFRNIA
jgi:hypothetical protein